MWRAEGERTGKKMEIGMKESLGQFGDLEQERLLRVYGLTLAAGTIEMEVVNPPVAI